MTITKLIDNDKIIISDDREYLKSLDAACSPFILVVYDMNEMNDTDFARYIYLADPSDPDLYNLTEDYLRLVIARSRHIPLCIGKTNRLLIQELSVKDCAGLMALFTDEKSDLKFIEQFFENEKDATEILKTYINDVYGFYDYGIWGIYRKDTLKLIGICGFTPRSNDSESSDYPDIELCYAINASERNKGYAFEACCLAINYASSNIDYDSLIVCISEKNLPSVSLYKKLSNLYPIKLIQKN